MQKKWIIKNEFDEYLSDEGWIKDINTARLFKYKSKAEENIAEAKEEREAAGEDNILEEFVVPVFAIYKTVTKTARATVEIREPLLSNDPKIHYAMELQDELYLLRIGNRFEVVEPLSNTFFKFPKEFNKWYRAMGFDEKRRNKITKWMKEFL